MALVAYILTLVNTVMKIFKNVLKRECVKPVVSHDDPSMDQKSSLLD